MMTMMMTMMMTIMTACKVLLKAASKPFELQLGSNSRGFCCCSAACTDNFSSKLFEI